MSTTTSTTGIVIRHVYPDDREALERLATVDSANVPEGSLLVAEVDGELLAALALEDGAVIADPFRATTHLVALLRLHAEHARDDRRSPSRRLAGALRAAAHLLAPRGGSSARAA